ncbi:het domain protein [Colletotrichum plurivorum]|uniref:Het domain protein n=1 Tax=Colletotrichum plurivorum TaxID=2175906 RepID=A0A8H6JIK7_9PEZI|nr:het domain protein [Colletotrichum plurivorum]
MRLINSESLKLKEFADGILPPYSILSHLWGDEADECCFQDFAHGEEHSKDIESKPGYAKIVNFCRVSRENGFYWAWADTVYINKSDYDELNTAINSMFAWYERSEVCYA